MNILNSNRKKLESESSTEFADSGLPSLVKTIPTYPFERIDYYRNKHQRNIYTIQIQTSESGIFKTGGS